MLYVILSKGPRDHEWEVENDGPYDSLPKAKRVLANCRKWQKDNDASVLFKIAKLVDAKD